MGAADQTAHSASLFEAPPSFPAYPSQGSLQMPLSQTLTHSYIIICGVGESQQQLWPLAAQFVGLVLGFQLYLCRARGEIDGHEAADQARGA